MTAAEFKVGDIVNHHVIPGGAATSTGHMVESVVVDPNKIPRVKIRVSGIAYDIQPIFLSLMEESPVNDELAAIAHDPQRDLVKETAGPKIQDPSMGPPFLKETINPYDLPPSARPQFPSQPTEFRVVADTVHEEETKIVNIKVEMTMEQYAALERLAKSKDRSPTQQLCRLAKKAISEETRRAFISGDVVV